MMLNLGCSCVAVIVGGPCLGSRAPPCDLWLGSPHSDLWHRV